MNILLAISSYIDGPDYVAFSTNSLNMELKHHKDILDAILFSREQLKKEHKDRVNQQFGEELSIIHGELISKSYFIESVLRGQAQFSDIDSEEYDPRYKNVTMEPPFHISIVLPVRTCLG